MRTVPCSMSTATFCGWRTKIGNAVTREKPKGEESRERLRDRQRLGGRRETRGKRPRERQSKTQRERDSEIDRERLRIELEREKERERERAREREREERRTESSGEAIMVSLFFLLGVSAKHFREDVSTTVSQNIATGSAT